MTIINDGTISAQIDIGLEKTIRGGTISIQGKTSSVRAGKVIYNRMSVLDNYSDILKKHYQKIELTDDQMNTYRYNPRLFCYDYYGSVDWTQVLLRINNMHTSMDFTRKRFLSFKESFYEVVLEILTIEEERLEKNRLDMKEPLK